MPDGEEGCGDAPLSIMKLHTFLYDLDYLLGDFRNIQGVRLSPNSGGVRIQAYCSNEPLFVADGQTIESVEGITGVCGILNIGRLRSILRAPGFSRASVKAAVRSGTIELSDGSGQAYSFYLCEPRLTERAVTIKTLKVHPAYEFEADLTCEGRDLLRYWQRQLASDGESEDQIRYEVCTKDGSLAFRHRVGPPTSPYIEFPFIRGVTGAYSTRYHQTGADLLPLLKFVGDTASAKFKLWSSGLHTVAVSTASVSIDFHLPLTLP